MTTSLKQLSDLIASSVDSLTKTCNANNINLPGLDDHFSIDAEASMRAKTSADVNLIVSAAMQLIASVAHPELSVYRLANGHVKSAAIRTALEAHVAEILREAGPAGMDVDKIAKYTNIDGGKLGRILRLLVSCHVFRELKPNVFANNRLSETLDTGKSVKDILASRGTKHDNTRGFPAFLELYTDEGPKITSCLSDAVMDPKTTHSTEINEAAFQRAFNTPLSFFEWLEQPEQDYKRKRYGVGMPGALSPFWPPMLLTAFDWKALSGGSVVVDVGGGIGYGRYSMDIAKQNPHLQFIVQTSRPYIKEGEKMWRAESAEPFIAERFRFQEQNIFAPQPQNNASVFVVFNIITHMSDTYAVKLLSQVRKVASKTTRLLLTSSIMKYACASEDDNTILLSGSSIAPAPDPLSANYATARQTDFAYMHDISALNLFNGRERTFEDLKAVMEKSGWRIIEVNQSDVGFDLVQAVPT